MKFKQRQSDPVTAEPPRKMQLKVKALKQVQKGYVQRLKDKLSIDIYQDPNTWKFDNPVLNLHRQLKSINEKTEEDNSIIKDELNVN